MWMLCMTWHLPLFSALIGGTLKLPSVTFLRFGTSFQRRIVPVNISVGETPAVEARCSARGCEFDPRLWQRIDPAQLWCDSVIHTCATLISAVSIFSCCWMNPHYKSALKREKASRFPTWGGRNCITTHAPPSPGALTFNICAYLTVWQLLWPSAILQRADVLKPRRTTSGNIVCICNWFLAWHLLWPQLSCQVLGQATTLQSSLVSRPWQGWHQI